jgi:hypothetical protein
MAKVQDKNFDLDNDGVITDQDLERSERLMNLENEDKKQDAQRQMAWLAAISMPIYAVLPLLPFVPVERLNTLASMSDMLFLSQASVIGLFFGAQAYMSKK